MSCPSVRILFTWTSWKNENGTQIDEQKAASNVTCMQFIHPLLLAVRKRTCPEARIMIHCTWKRRVGRVRKPSLFLHVKDYDVRMKTNSKTSKRFFRISKEIFHACLHAFDVVRTNPRGWDGTSGSYIDLFIQARLETCSS